MSAGASTPWRRAGVPLVRPRGGDGRRSPCSRPRGGVALVWNRRDERVAWMHGFSRILDAQADVPRYAPWRAGRGFDGSPPSSRWSCRSWPNRGEAGRDVVLERIGLDELVAALDEEPRAQLVEESRHLLDTHPETRGRDDVAPCPT